MKHGRVYKKEGFYTGWPLPSILPDGRLSVVVQSAPRPEHYALGQRITLVSDDEGESWQESDDPTIPSNWPATSTREGHDRFERILPSGRYFTTGGVSYEQWSSDRREEAESLGLNVVNHPDPNSGMIVVGGHKVYIQWSDDSGQTWSRQQWRIPRSYRLNGFPRPAYLEDGTILAPLYDIAEGPAKDGGTTYVFRVENEKDCELIEMPGAGRGGNEFALIETQPGTVLAMIRDAEGKAEGYLLESWSHDSGRSWSHPLQTPVWGYPPHMLKLHDGRILCVYSYRRDPMGIRAVLSSDGGRSWDMDNEIILRDDAVATRGKRVGQNSSSDLGYPLSVQLSDGTIFTTYYFVEADGIVHCAWTKWQA